MITPSFLKSSAALFRSTIALAMSEVANDSTLFSRIGYAKSFLHEVSKAGTYKKKILRSVLRFIFKGWDDQDGMDLSFTCR